METETTEHGMQGVCARLFDSGDYTDVAGIQSVTGLQPREIRKHLDIARPQWRAKWDVDRRTVERYLERVKRERGEGSYAENKRRLQSFLDFKGDKLITPAMVDEWRASLNVANSSLNRYMSPMRTFLRWAQAVGDVEGSLEPFLTVLKDAPVERKEPVILMPSEIRSLLTAALDAQGKGANALRIWIVGSLITGCRPGELEKLKGKDVKLARKSFVVKGKGLRERRVSYGFSKIGPALFEFLRTRRDDNDSLMPCKAGTGGWKTLLRAAGLDESLPRYVLRKTSRTCYAEAGTLPERYLRRMFGHGTRVADNYYMPDNDAVWSTGETVDEWLGCERELAILADRIRHSEIYNGRKYKPGPFHPDSTQEAVAAPENDLNGASGVEVPLEPTEG